MRDSDNINSNLETVFEKYAALHLQQSSEMNKRVDRLVENMGQLADKMGSLAAVVAKSEERHNSHSERSERIEKVQSLQGRDFKEYKQNNDNRIVTIEKQVLLLDIEDKKFNARWAAIDKWKLTILTTISIAAIAGYMGLK